MKKCSRCDELKELSAFSKNRAAKDGLQNNCKVCSSKSAKKWKAENKDYWKKYWKKWEAENKEKRRDYDKKWKAENKEKVRNYKKDYRTNETPCVYRIKHKQNGCYYLGQTTQHLFHRVASHFSPSSDQKSPFTGLNKDDWIIETLCYGTEEQVKHLEKVLLEKRVGIDPNCLNKKT